MSQRTLLSATWEFYLRALIYRKESEDIVVPYRQYRAGATLERMYAQRLRVDLCIGGQRRPCPLEWLDGFCMRNFTGSAEFDDTLPLADGLIEAGFRVAPARLEEALEAWLTKRGKSEGQPLKVEIQKV